MVDGTREFATTVTKQDAAILRYDDGEEEVKRSTSPAMNDCRGAKHRFMMIQSTSPKIHANLHVHVYCKVHIRVGLV